jgi:hypothetical protein
MKCSKCLLLLLFSISFTQLTAQTLKRKYRGIYTGQIPSYEVKFGQGANTVSKCELKVYISRDSLKLEIGTYSYASGYTFEIAEQDLILTAPREQSGIPEQFILSPRTKTILRKGHYPQPDATLIRIGKLPRR